jgi:ribose/xylose/arabinose/galactoside ABC-type transport system permease subunit
MALRLPKLPPLVAKAMLEVILVLLCVYFAFTAEGFLTFNNFLNILQQIALIGIVAFGMTMVIIAREIDLSVGSLVASSGCLLAVLVAKGVPIPVAILVVLCFGALSGAFTGFMRVFFEVPSFIATLALYTAHRGLALKLTKGFSITPFPEWFSILGGRLPITLGDYTIGVPVPALVLLAVFVVVHFLMRHTTFGAAVYAVGGNDEAARLSGIHVARIRLLVFAVLGALTAVSGILTASKIMAGNPGVGVSLELDAIAAVIIGGTSFAGGVGTVWGTLIGVVFIGVIINGMTLLDVASYNQLIVRGALILAAVLINRLQEVRR